MTTVETLPVQTPPSEPFLKPVLGRNSALKPIHVLVVTLFGVLIVMLNLLPLRATDLWGHVSYGRWIVAHGALPTSDPWLPLAEGMRVIDSAWLSQVILAKVSVWSGAEGLSNLFALTVWLTYVVLARTFYLQTRRPGLMIFGTLLVLTVGWSRLATIRPEMFAALCFAVLLWLLVRSGWTQAVLARGARAVSLWVGVPLIFCLWANLHGSFMFGLAVLGCMFMGRVLEVAWQTRSPRAVLADRCVQRWLILTELAAAATLVNPYGIDLWIHVLTFGSNPNLAGILEWSPLTLYGVGGREFAMSCVLIAVVLRLSRRKLGAAGGLMLLLFALGAAARIRVLGWYAPLLAVVLMPHFDDVTRRARVALRHSNVSWFWRFRSWKLSLVCLVIAWIAFSFTGFAKPVLGGKPRTAEALYNDETPLGLATYLREHPPEGQVFNPDWWGDWLVFTGQGKFTPFATVNTHMLPVEVWRDYQRLLFAEPGWDSLLDRYRITTMVLDKKIQAPLVAMMRRFKGWTPRYEDDVAIVFTKAPLATAIDAPAKPAADQASAH